jgi:hypothetical protein
LNFYRFASLLLLFALAACASNGGLISQKFDPLTAVSITYSNVPLVFYRDDSGRAAFARRYLHLGPLEVNRMGSLRYYLWLGIWNTMQRPSVETSRDGFESIVIFADGEPLTLDIAGWTAESIGASEPIYVKPVSSSADAYYEVTVDHLRLIAASSDIRIQSTGSRSQSYEAWDDQDGAKASLDVFLDNSAY